MTDNNFFFDHEFINDRINVTEKIDISLKKIKSKDPSEMVVSLSGKNVDKSIANALRRTIMMDIPIYSFHRSNIKIDSERTVYIYNTDFLYNQIESLVIFDITNDFDLEDPNLYLPNNVMRNIFGKFIRDEYYDETLVNDGGDNKKKTAKIELSIALKNTSSIPLYVSTHHCTLKINGAISDSYKKYPPISLCVLRPGDELYLSADANLGTSKMHAMYDAASTAISIEKSPSEYIIKFSTLGQLSNEDIFKKACFILEKKLNNLYDHISKTYISENVDAEMMEIELHGENHTIGHILASALQKQDSVKSAGYNVPHPLIKMVKISYEPAKKDANKIKILLETIKYLSKIYRLIYDNFN